MQGPHASPPSGRIAQTHPHPHKQTHAATKRFGGTDELRKEACRCALRRATRVTSTSPRHSRPGKNHGWADVYTCGGERFSSLPLFSPLDHNRDSLLLPLALRCSPALEFTPSRPPPPSPLAVASPPSPPAGLLTMSRSPQVCRLVAQNQAQTFHVLPSLLPARFWCVAVCRPRRGIEVLT